MLYFGVYGYEITKTIDLDSFILEPISTRYEEAKELALDNKKFHLTAIGKVKNELDLEALFDLAAILTFCQQQWVIVSNPINFPDNKKIKFPDIFEEKSERPSSGALIQSDSFDPDGRVNLLKLCAEKLTDERFEKSTNFRKVFFRNVEVFRISNQLIDLTYYLDFSALEILSRTILNDYKTKNIAEVTYRLLRQYEFPVTQDNNNERHLGMQTYSHLRNSLFHNGEFEKTFSENGNEVTLKLTDYAGYLSLLVPDLLLKVMGYDNDRINWNRWLDRQPFK